MKSHEHIGNLRQTCTQHSFKKKLDHNQRNKNRRPPAETRRTEIKSVVDEVKNKLSKTHKTYDKSHY